MNPRGWGGARTGTGPKPRARREPLTVVPDSQERPQVSAIPPEDLPADQRDFWHRYASLAIEKRTLTPHTVGAFRLLCETSAEQLATKAVIQRDGRTYVKAWTDSSGQEHQELKAHPLTSTYGRLSKALEALMARFSLAPFGKPVDPIQKRPAANPWSNVGMK